MKTLSIFTYLILISFIKINSQVFTYTEINNLIDGDHPAGFIELLEKKGFEYLYTRELETNEIVSDDLDRTKPYYYTHFLELSNGGTITTFTLIDENDSNNRVFGESGTIQIGFTYKAKDEYEYLIERIKKYHRFINGPMYISSTFTNYQFYSDVEDGRMVYRLHVYFNMFGKLD